MIQRHTHSQESRDRVAAVLDEALSIPIDDRRQLIASSSLNASEQAEALEMLCDLEDSDGFWDDKLPTQHGSLAQSDARSASPLGPVSHDCFGRYTLLDHIGDGGFGVVFRAEQTEPFKRDVAVKVIKNDFVSEEVRRRFDFEREALAKMNHSAIAGILDGGLSQHGRLWFAMELVDGVPITRAATHWSLDLADRLRLLTKVLDGVAHAHRRGVLHRDIKPSNILVTQDREVKIIDFGISRSVEGSEHSPPALGITREAQLLGTPEYMSPEQAAGKHSELDTRTDVYSLGVLLYELLTGTTPHDHETLQRTPASEIEAFIRDSAFDPPSDRLRRRTQSGEMNRSTHGLHTHLPRELDWVAAKALSASPSDRYSSVDDLHADIRAFLSDQPVAASPPSKAYRFKKFVRRNRMGVSLSGAIALTVFAGLGLSSAGFIEAREEAHKAARAAAAEADARQDAEAQRDRALANMNFVHEVLKRSARPGSDRVDLQDFLDATQDSIQSGEMDLSTAERADLSLAVARAYSSIGHYDLAERSYEDAQQNLSKTAPSDSKAFLALVAERVENLSSGGDLNEAAELAYGHLDRAISKLGLTDDTTVKLTLLAGQGNAELGRIAANYRRVFSALTEAAERGEPAPFLQDITRDFMDFADVYQEFQFVEPAALAMTSDTHTAPATEFGSTHLLPSPRGYVPISSESSSTTEPDLHHQALAASRATTGLDGISDPALLEDVTQAIGLSFVRLYRERALALDRGVAISPLAYPASSLTIIQGSEVHFESGRLHMHSAAASDALADGYILADTSLTTRDGWVFSGAVWLSIAEWTTERFTIPDLTNREAERFVQRPSAIERAIPVGAEYSRCIASPLQHSPGTGRASILKARLQIPAEGVVISIRTPGRAIALVDGQMPLRNRSSSAIPDRAMFAFKPDSAGSHEIEIRLALSQDLAESGTAEPDATIVEVRPQHREAALASSRALSAGPENWHKQLRADSVDLICDRRYGLALALLDEAERVVPRDSKNDLIEWTYIMQGQAWCHGRENRLDEAIRIYRNAYEMRVELLGEHDDRTQHAKHDLDRELRLKKSLARTSSRGPTQ